MHKGCFVSSFALPCATVLPVVPAREALQCSVWDSLLKQTLLVGCAKWLWSCLGDTLCSTSLILCMFCICLLGRVTGMSGHPCPLRTNIPEPSYPPLNHQDMLKLPDLRREKELCLHPRAPRCWYQWIATSEGISECAVAAVTAHRCPPGTQGSAL